MKPINHDAYLRRDLIKLICLFGAISGAMAIFLVTPALSTPTFLALVFTMLLSPMVAALERKGLSRALAIGIVFFALGSVFLVFALWLAKSGQAEWASFKEAAPTRFQAALDRLRFHEANLKNRFSILSSVELSDTLFKWGRQTGQWFVDNGASMVGSFVTWTCLVPPLTFVMLNEGRSIRRNFFQLVPNRFFESFFHITHDITTAISDYLRAKMLEALIVGLITALGLALVGAPYVLVLAVFSGLTNIIPYAGPIMGAAPGLIYAAFDPSQSHLLLPMAMVYVIANLVDMFVVFPVVVAKLVKLHPLLLIAVVAVGQRYYGLIGMLISIPIATALKVILGEIYSAVYERRTSRVTPYSGAGSDDAWLGDA